MRPPEPVLRTRPFQPTRPKGLAEPAARFPRSKPPLHAIRVFYTFDPRRDAIVLIGGDKTGASSDRFYREYIPQAERILREYLAEIEEEDNG